MNLTFQDQMIGLIRAFGLHKPDQTPCGQPVAVTEAHALMVLSSDEQFSQKKLATLLSLEKSTVSRLVRQLQKRGWITRTQSLQDKRMIELRLTEEGRTVHAQLVSAREAKFQRVLSAIPVEQRTSVIDSLSILVEAMRESH